MTRVHEIYIYDEDPVTVDNCSRDGLGVTFTVDDETTFLPWSQVTRIVSRRPDPEPATGAQAEAVAPAEAEADDTENGDGDSGAGGEADTSDGEDVNGGDAKEWPDADNATMRAWAQSQGVPVSTSGPVSNDVKTKYAAAHAAK